MPLISRLRRLFFKVFSTRYDVRILSARLCIEGESVRLLINERKTLWNTKAVFAWDFSPQLKNRPIFDTPSSFENKLAECSPIRRS